MLSPTSTMGEPNLTLRSPEAVGAVLGSTGTTNWGSLPASVPSRLLSLAGIH